MPPWNNQFDCQSYFGNKIIQKVIEDEKKRTKTGNNQKFIRNVPEESVEAI